MDDLTVKHFDEFFSALWGKRPFSWQSKLAERVITNMDKPWPDAIALPTASGKTACIDIAVFALAAQAGRLEAGRRLLAPRRIFFVVDRRVIVDEAYSRARHVAARLSEERTGILEEIAHRLRYIARGEWQGAKEEKPLAVYELRGGMFRSEAWAHSPLQPTVVASTVDQLGSRLLFRPYGRGSGMSAIYAGLAANESLILLDEAHCAQPFLQTLQAVNKYRDWGQASLAMPFYPVVMSATPPPDLSDVFRDDSEEPNDPTHPLGLRQLASKPATLRVTAAKGKKAARVMAQVMVTSAESLISDERKAIVIFSNRVATAREAYRILRAKHGNRAVLLTGRMRPIDRDVVIEEHLSELASTRSADRNLDRPVFVVATQTLEVGADLDFDGLVSECASLDSLRQRFGRLNRMGRPIVSRAQILIRQDQTENTEDDPVYGAAIAKTWIWLTEHLVDGGAIDFGIKALGMILPGDERIQEYNAPAANAPVMLPAHVDCWVQTSPAPRPSPDVAPFLRGPDRGTADVQVCWRADIDLTEDRLALSKDILTLCPPSSPECLSVPIEVFRNWLSGDDQDDDTADVESWGAVSSPPQERTDGARHALLWRGRNDVRMTTSPRDVRPGDIVVLPSDLGSGTLADLPPSSNAPSTLDWGDRANCQARAKAQLRLNPSVIREWPDCDSKARMLSRVNDWDGLYMEDSDALTQEVRDALSRLATDGGAPAWLRDTAAALCKERGLRRRIILHPLGGFILKGSKLLPRPESDPDSFSDEDDPASCGTVAIPLFEHLDGVGAYARRFAKGCGLATAIAEIIERAGSLHDLGKADPRFQSLLRNGNLWIEDILLAKSNEIPQGRLSYLKARKASCYPDGGRHELLSVRLLESQTSLLPEDETLRDLVLHLIASHHGYCRPFAPVVADEQPVDVGFALNGTHFSHSSETGLERLDSGVSDRFWRLTRNYGWWGLAWLEAILRLADHRRSEDEEEQGSRNEENER